MPTATVAYEDRLQMEAGRKSIELKGPFAPGPEGADGSGARDQDDEQLAANWSAKQSEPAAWTAPSSASGSPASSSNSTGASFRAAVGAATACALSGESCLDLGNKCGKCQNHNVERSKKGE